MKEFLYLCSVFIKLIYRMDAKRILFIAQEITPYLPEQRLQRYAETCRKAYRSAVVKLGLSCPSSAALTSAVTSCTK